MPELPEVETIRRQLNSELKNKKIRDVEIRLAKLIKSPLAFFRRMVSGAVITGVDRRAKILLFRLSSGQTMLIHLKMTGQLIYRDRKKLKAGGHPIPGGTVDLPNKYSHVIFTFTNGSKLYFNDLRRFGFLRVMPTSQVHEYFIKQKTGPEPLDKEFTLELFSGILKKRPNLKIKQLIMDQSLIAGVGNIYATEGLFRAGIRPMRPAKALSRKEINKLYWAINNILTNAILKQGTSAKNYVDAYGQPGEYVPLLKVYGRKGLPCYRCKTKIAAISLAGRGTAYCPKCQK